MRDAIGLLDQLVPLADGPVSLAAARDMLGVADPASLQALLDQVLEGRPSAALDTLAAVYEGGGELRQVVRGLMERCRDLLVAAVERRDGSARARLSAILDGLLHLDGEVRRHAEPRFLVEATLVRLAVEPGGSLAPAPAVEVAQAPATPAPAAAAVTTDALSAPASTPRPASNVRAPVDQAVSPDGWRGVLEALSPKVRAYFRGARPEVEGQTLTLYFPYVFHHKMASEHVGQIEPLVRGWLGEGARIDLRPPSQVKGNDEAAAPLERPPAPEEDPLIKAAERTLEGRVVRVRPLKESQ